MTPRTQSFIAELQSVEWFFGVGKPAPTGVTRVVPSWEEAVVACESEAWENAQITASNDLGRRIQRVSYDLYARWNEVASSLDLIDELVSLRTRKVVEQYRLPTLFVRSVNSDISHICMELEFLGFSDAKISRSPFYTTLARLYLDGRFPCGWVGDDLTCGQFVVF